MKNKILLLVSLVIIIISCNNIEHNNSDIEIPEGLKPLQLTECVTPNKDSKYETAELYFKKGSQIDYEVFVHYFQNDEDNPFSDKFIKERIEFSDRFFEEDNKKLKFKKIKRYTTPTDNELAMEAVKRWEQAYPLKDLDNNILKDSLGNIMYEEVSGYRDAYIIDLYTYWDEVFHVDGYINVYIYGNNEGSIFAGVAGGIGSTYFAILHDYMHPLVRTFEHEAGHALGEKHTFEGYDTDPTDGLNETYGDGICDTGKVPMNLIGFLQEYPDYIGSHFENIPTECIEKTISNIMNYQGDRNTFTEGQFRKMDYELEMNRELRETVTQFKTRIPNIPKAI